MLTDKFHKGLTAHREDQKEMLMFLTTPSATRKSVHSKETSIGGRRKITIEICFLQLSTTGSRDNVTHPRSALVQPATALISIDPTCPTTDTHMVQPDPHPVQPNPNLPQLDQNLAIPSNYALCAIEKPKSNGFLMRSYVFAASSEALTTYLKDR